MFITACPTTTEAFQRITAQEFTSQGNQEKHVGIPVMDREKTYMKQI